MKLLSEVEILKRMLNLIYNENTGNSSEFARRIGVSRSKLYLLFNDLKEQGIEIQFDKSINHYIIHNCKVEIRNPLLVTPNNKELT